MDVLHTIWLEFVLYVKIMAFVFVHKGWVHGSCIAITFLALGWVLGSFRRELRDLRLQADPNRPRLSVFWSVVYRKLFWLLLAPSLPIFISSVVIYWNIHWHAMNEAGVAFWATLALPATVVSTLAVAALVFIWGRGSRYAKRAFKEG